MNGIRALSLAAVVAACFIYPTGASAGCLPEDPECRPAPPQTVEVRPDPRLGSLDRGELADPAYVQPMVVTLPMPLPRRVGEAVASAKGGDLARAQDPTEVTCGVNALGKAMDRLGGAAPTTAAMVRYLRDRGWLYEYGTGVEELALTAQAYGYLWSESFHEWDLPRLLEEVNGGRSVVVGLGINGPDEPGHFVTVTGLSADGRWVTYDDPVLGVRVVSVEEFQAEWEAQGNSGVVVRRGPAGAGNGLPGEGPLVPLGMAAAALAGVVALAPLGTKRKGIGGHANPPGVAGRWVRRDEPVYADVTEVVGYDVKREKVAKYKTVEVQEGWDVETVRVARMKTVVVQDGWDVQTERRPVYQTESYVSGYRTWTQRVPEYDYIGRRRKLIGYDTLTRQEAIWSMRTVVAGYQTVEKREPRLVVKEVFDHWDYEDKRVPHMVPKQVPDGYDEVPVRVPMTATRSKPVGTTVKWVWEAGGQAQTGTDDEDRMPLSRLDDAGETVIRATTPVGPLGPTESVARRFQQNLQSPFLNNPVSATGQVLKWGTRAEKVDFVKPVQFVELPSGMISVRISNAVGDGEKEALRREVGYAGTRYSAESLAASTSSRLLRGAAANESLGIGLGIAVLANAYTYSLGDHRQEGVLSSGFAASTMVDFGVAGLTGLAAATIVAAAVAGLATLGVVGAATLPLWGAVAAVAAASLPIGFALSEAAEKTHLKERVAAGLSFWSGLVNGLGENALNNPAVGRARPGMR